MSITLQQKELIRACSRDEAAYEALLALCDQIADDAEGRVQQSYEDLMRRLPGMIYRLRRTPDYQYHFDYVSPRSQEITGIPAEAVMQDPSLILNILSTQMTPDYEAQAEKAIRTQSVFAWEEEFDVNGEKRWWRIEGFPRQLQDGTVLWDGIQTDVTREKVVESALSRQYAYFEAAAESGIAGFLILQSMRDADNRLVDFTFTHANSKAEEQFATLRENLIGKTLTEVFPPERRATFFEQYAAVVRSGEPFETEYLVDDDSPGAGWYRQQVVALGDGVAISNIEITEQKEIELALREAKQRYDDLAANIPGMFYRVHVDQDGKHTFEYVSPRCLEMNGVTAEEAMADAKRLMELIPANRRDEYRVAGFKALHSMSTFYWEDCINVNGLKRWRRFEARPTPLPDGSTLWDGVQTDITSQKFVEQALRESQHFSEQITAMVPDLVYVYDLNDRQNVYCNPAIEKILGYRSDEMYWMSEQLLPTIMHPEDYARQQASLSRFEHAADGEIIKSEYRWQHKNGDWRWIQIDDVVFERNEDGSPRLLLGIAQDITERKENEIALMASEKRFRALADNSPDYIYVIDARLQQGVYANRETLLGYSVSELNQHGSIGFAAHPEDADRLDLYMKRLYSGQVTEPTSIEGRMQSKDGEWHWIEIRHTVFTSDEDGNPVQYLGTISMIDTRKAAEAMALDQERLSTELFKEKELSQLKTLMMVRISHEFRTPLAVIASSSEMLERYHDRMPAERQMERLRQIHDQVDRIARLLDDISLVIRQQSSSNFLERMPVDVEGLCRDGIAKIELGLGAKHKFQLNSQPLEHFNADPFLFNHIISNLLSNAVKFSPPRTTVTVDLSIEGEMLRLSVHDEGFGILDVDRVRIFEPFYRGRNIGEVSGIGLGLSIVKDAVELHGGRIEIESTPETGTTFAVYMPVTTGTMTEMPALSPRA